MYWILCICLHLSFIYTTKWVCDFEWSTFLYSFDRADFELTCRKQKWGGVKSWASPVAKPFPMLLINFNLQQVTYLEVRACFSKTHITCNFIIQLWRLKEKRITMFTTICVCACVSSLVYANPLNPSLWKRCNSPHPATASTKSGTRALLDTRHERKQKKCNPQESRTNAGQASPWSQ